MQYIKKQSNPPENWDEWFTTATNNRTYDYNQDYSALTRLPEAKQFLIDEQNGLCAYCQQIITGENASIEHVIPKEFNIELSTCYHNLVAVCKNPPKDKYDKLHCDKEKKNRLITPFIFASNSDVTDTQNNGYFTMGVDCFVRAKNNVHQTQADAFINTLNLNHTILIDKRMNVLNGIVSAYQSQNLTSDEKKSFFKNKINELMTNRKQIFRQFLLMYMLNKIGIH